MTLTCMPPVRRGWIPIEEPDCLMPKVRGGGFVAAMPRIRGYGLPPTTD